MINRFNLGETGRSATLSVNKHNVYCLVLDEDGMSVAAGFGDSPDEATRHLAERLRELARLVEDSVHV